MKIVGLDKVSLLDFPGCVAAIVFTNGCNMACPYCHNSSIATCKYEEIPQEDIFAYLSKRKGLIDGVVISGGEPLIHNDILDFIKKIKDMGYLVKLDTNGYLPDRLKKVLDSGLIDYVAMDIKASIKNYPKVTGMECIDYDRIKRSIDILEQSKVEHEFRTTFIKTYHTLSEVKDIVCLIPNAKHYYIQSFKDSDDVPKHSLESFNDNELAQICSLAKTINKNAEIK